ncbi:MAG: hypothetical protein LLG06_01380 [Desulfobacteraceae bacterium]|nr:hypothetical protein [Desulfobacteraceae bacterium]
MGRTQGLRGMKPEKPRGDSAFARLGRIVARTPVTHLEGNPWMIRCIF